MNVFMEVTKRGPCCCCKKHWLFTRFQRITLKNGKELVSMNILEHKTYREKK